MKMKLYEWWTTGLIFKTMFTIGLLMGGWKFTASTGTYIYFLITGVLAIGTFATCLDKFFRAKESAQIIGTPIWKEDIQGRIMAITGLVLSLIYIGIIIGFIYIAMKNFDGRMNPK